MKEHRAERRAHSVERRGTVPVPSRENMFYRTFDLLERGALNEESREIDISFSSELPVERWFGAEILLHGEGNVDLKRLKNVGSVIYGHMPYDMKNIIGPIKKVYMDKDNRQARALIGFDDDDTGNLAMKKVKSRSLKGVSFGYVITKGRRVLEGEEWTDPDSQKTYKGPAIVATRWEPYEITLTPIPADPTVGLGREMTRSLEGIEIVGNNIKNMGISFHAVIIFRETVIHTFLHYMSGYCP